MTDAQIVTAFFVVNLAIAAIGTAVTQRPRPGNDPVQPTPFEPTGDSLRKRNAKRFNEHLKLVATLLNNGALAGVVSGILGPVATSSAQFTWAWYAIVLPGSAALLVSAHLILRLWLSEE